MAERSLTGAVALLVVSTVWGASVSVREDVVGEPLGWRAPGPVTTHLAVGWGSGLSAPWPMVAVALADVVREDAARPSGRRSAVVGAALLGGVLVEPVTWGRRARSPLIASTVVANLVAGVLLVATGTRRRRGRLPGRTGRTPSEAGTPRP